jgi:hypothetical protein
MQAKAVMPTFSTRNQASARGASDDSYRDHRASVIGLHETIERD